jgi:hypothetical protein
MPKYGSITASIAQLAIDAAMAAASEGTNRVCVFCAADCEKRVQLLAKQ